MKSENSGKPPIVKGQGIEKLLEVQLQEAKDRIRDLEAQHKDLVFRNHFLSHRPDLKPERLEAYTAFVEQVDALRKKVAMYRELACRR